MHWYCYMYIFFPLQYSDREVKSAISITMIELFAFNFKTFSGKNVYLLIQKWLLKTPPKSFNETFTICDHLLFSEANFSFLMNDFCKHQINEEKQKPQSNECHFRVSTPNESLKCKWATPLLVNVWNAGDWKRPAGFLFYIHKDAIVFARYKVGFFKVITKKIKI